MFDRADTTPAASGFTYGQNIQDFTFSRSMAERFSEVRVYTTANAQSLTSDFPAATLVATRSDPNVARLNFRSWRRAASQNSTESFILGETQIGERFERAGGSPGAKDAPRHALPRLGSFVRRNC